MDFNLYFYLSNLVLFSLLLWIPAFLVPVPSLKFLSSLGHSIVWSTGMLHPPQICAYSPYFLIHIYVVSLVISLKVDHIWELVLQSSSSSQSSYTLTIKKKKKKTRQNEKKHKKPRGWQVRGSLYHKERKSMPVGFSSRINKYYSKTVLQRSR